MSYGDLIRSRRLSYRSPDSTTGLGGSSTSLLSAKCYGVLSVEGSYTQYNALAGTGKTEWHIKITGTYTLKCECLDNPPSVGAIDIPDNDCREGDYECSRDFNGIRDYYSFGPCPCEEDEDSCSFEEDFALPGRAEWEPCEPGGGGWWPPRPSCKYWIGRVLSEQEASKACPANLSVDCKPEPPSEH